MKSMFKGVFGALVVMLALCGLTAASALAAGAPTAETTPVAGVTETTAVANGTVNPNGAETKVYAEYGPTTSYGTKTKEHNAGSGTKVVGESWNLSGLTVNTTYHIRVVATNSYGTSYGADEVFSTPTEPEAVVASGKITELKVEALGRSADSVEWGALKTLACEESEFSGHFINSRELEGKMTWYRCSGKNAACTNGKEEVQSEPLKGTLGYINRTKKEVGLRLAGASSETWANNVSCSGGTFPLTGSLGGLLKLPVNTKIPAGKGLALVYTEKEGKQTTGELGGQLLWESGYSDFAFAGSLTGSANKEFEIKA